MKEKFTKFLVLLFSLATLSTYAQQKKVSGTVTAKSDGLPLPAVSVVVKGTSLGAQTDADGKYSITVPENGTLIFSYIGFVTREVKVGATSTVNIALESDEKQLGEVVVTALGIQRKKNELAYSAQQVKGDEISKARDGNFVNSLSGKVAGLEIRKNNTMGGSTNIVLRGAKSLTGNNQALFVVDGVPYSNSNTNSSDQVSGRSGYDYGNAAADINPDDIESVNVLKGAAATALYGSMAGNGVVMITTKKGGKGLGITINSGVTVGTIDKSTFPKYQTQYGAGYGKYYGPNEDGWFNQSDVNGDGKMDLVVPYYEDASFGGKFDPSIMVYDWASLDPTSPTYNQARPWVAAQNGPLTFFENPVSTINSFTIDNGGEKGYFKLGYSNNIEKGILPNSKITKNILNFGASYNISQKLTAAATINASQVKGNGRYGTGYDDKNIAGNFRQWFQTNVDIQEQKDAFERNNQHNVTWNRNGVESGKAAYWDNPYYVRYENFENDSRTRVAGNASLNYKIASWVDVMGRLSVDTYSQLQEERQGYESVTTSAYSNYQKNFTETNYDLMANFNKNISSALTFKGVLGLYARDRVNRTMLTTTNGGLVVPGLYSISNSTNPIDAPVEADQHSRLNSAYASASFGFREFLFLDVTGRVDKSSTLPTNNNTYFYPSASLGFLFSKFTASTAPWISLGKVRVNYAEVGNDTEPYRVYDVYDKPTAYGSTTLFSVPSVKNNSDLQSERTKSFETGLEMSFVDQRVGFDITYYNSKTENQILPVQVSRATGYNSMYVNAGTLHNKGVEVSAFGTAIKTPNFSWTVNLNWSMNRNNVTDFPDGITNLQINPLTLPGSVSINASVNQPYGNIQGKDYTYNEKGERIVGANGYYVLSTTTNNVIGNINPDWIGGIGNTFKYKNVNLSFLIDIRKGGDVFSLDQYYGLATGLFAETAGLNDLGNPMRDPVTNDSKSGGIIFPGVLADGTPNTKRVPVAYGTLGYQRNPHSAFVYDASYVKLREVALNYSFPSKIISHLGPVKGLDISLIGRNLWIIDKNLPNADPEDGLSSGNVQGYQTGSYPTTRTFGVNLKVKF